MIAVWMLYGVAVGVALLVAAVAVEAVARSACRPSRWVWLAAIVATLTLTALALRPVNQPSTGTSGSEGGAGAGHAGAAGSFVPIAAWVVGRPELVSMLRRLDPALSIAWATASLVALVLFAGSALRMRRRRSRWRRAVVRGVPVLVTDGAGPAVVGFMSPEIVLPPWVLRLDDASQELVVAHEWQHVASRDPLLVLAAFASVVAAPWNVPLWVMRARLRRAVEMDCDGRVLSYALSRAAYASLLIEMGERTSGVPALAPALVGWTTDLERRVVAILRPSRSRPWRSAAGLTLGAALAIAVIAAPRPALPRPEIQEPAALVVTGHDVGLAVRVRPVPPTDATEERRGLAGGNGVRAGRARAGAGGGGSDRGSAGPAGSAPMVGAAIRPNSDGGGGGSVGARLQSIGISIDSIAALVERRHPEVFTAPARAEPVVIALAFDTAGRVTHSGVIEGAWTDSTPLAEASRVIVRLFPELGGRRLRSTGRVIGDLRRDGRPARRAIAVFGVFDPA